VGLAGKFIQSKILDSASTFAVEMGIQSRPYWDRLRLALAFANMGGKMKFEQESEKLPFLARIGSALQITSRWLVSLDVIAPNDNAAYAALGTEYLWRVKDSLNLAGRLGYDSRTAGDITGVTGLSFGFGLGWEKLSFDYAFLPYGSLGVTHRISLALRWGQSSGSENSSGILKGSPYIENPLP
jgi:hypothetical protein